MTYQVGETIRLNAAITNVAGAAVNPTTVNITINKPDGSVAQASTAMENPETGSYYYDYTITTDVGAYHYSVKATSGTRVTIEKDVFVVDESI